MNKRLSITLATALFLLLAIIIVIKLAQGYRPDLKNGGSLRPTGLLSANSFPESAQVWVNGKLTTATDDTLNLTPGDYDVKIEKVGYLPWQKKLAVEAELVTETNARLFPAVPELKPLTLTGINQPVLSPDGNSIAFNIATSSGQFKAGLWALDLSTRPLSFPPKPKQISQTTPAFNFAKSSYRWSPASDQILVSLGKEDFLLETDRLNTTFQNITRQLTNMEKQWQEESSLRQKQQLSRFPEGFQAILTKHAEIIAFSPDETKLLYLVKENVQLPSDLIPSVPAASSQPEERDLKANILYVYDRRDDRNFRIHEAIKYISWFPDSRHLVYVAGAKIKIVEYDGQNETVVYAGVFEENFVAVWPDASRLVILANLNPDSPLPPNLYALNLK